MSEPPSGAAWRMDVKSRSLDDVLPGRGHVGVRVLIAVPDTGSIVVMAYSPPLPSLPTSTSPTLITSALTSSRRWLHAGAPVAVSNAWSVPSALRTTTRDPTMEKQSGQELPL